MRKIIISYRRSDSAWTARSIFERLTAYYGKESVFMDIDNIPFGVDFRDHIEEVLQESHILLAVIGPKWLTAGRRKGIRIHEENDLVRLEIETALRRNIPVIPVLVDGSAMPEPSDLPDSLKSFAYRNAAEVNAGREFHQQMDRLIRAMDAVLGEDGGAEHATAEAPIQPPQPVVSEVSAAPSEPEPAKQTQSRSERSRRRLYVGVGAAAAALILLGAAVTLWSDRWQFQAHDDPAPPTTPHVEGTAIPPAGTSVTPNPGGTPKPQSAPESQDASRSHATPKPKDIIRDCGVCPELIVVPAGEFTMGAPTSESDRTNERPQHLVKFAAPFAVGRFAVTFDEWDACVAEGGCKNTAGMDQGWGRGRRPVINVSWNDAQSYVTWLSRKTDRTYRLLSEAEREYVTRAGTRTPYWWGSTISTTQANYRPTIAPNDSAGNIPKRTLPVDSFAPNAWGLYQVHGNVSEWVADCYNDDYKGAPSDGTPWMSGDCNAHVLRGGSWISDPEFLRSANRPRPSSIAPYRIGFRVARSLTDH